MYRLHVYWFNSDRFADIVLTRDQENKSRMSPNRMTELEQKTKMVFNSRERSGFLYISRNGRNDQDQKVNLD